MVVSSSARKGRPPLEVINRRPPPSPSGPNVNSSYPVPSMVRDSVVIPPGIDRVVSFDIGLARDILRTSHQNRDLYRRRITAVVGKEEFERFGVRSISRAAIRSPRLR